MAMVVKGILRFEEKGKPGIPLERGHFQAGFGMEGDRHAGDGDRQITMISSEVKEWMDQTPQKGLCFRRYKANLQVEGLDIEKMVPGRVLRCGTAVFEVSQVQKNCFPECPLFRQGEECRLSSGGFYLKVTGTGEVSKNDTMTMDDDERSLK